MHTVTGLLHQATSCVFQEYEERLAQLKASYEAEQASRARLEEDISSLRNHYNLKLFALEENLRKEAGVDEAGGGCAVQAGGSLVLLIREGVGFGHKQSQTVFAKSDLWQPLLLQQALPGSNSSPCSQPSLIDSRSGNWLSWAACEIPCPSFVLCPISLTSLPCQDQPGPAL